MEEFVHEYEMESLQMGITARKDVINQVSGFFPKTESPTTGLFRTAQAFAARQEKKRESESKEHDEGEASEATFSLVIAGNTKECFHNRLRNVQLAALSAAILKTKLSCICKMDLRFNELGEEHDDDDAKVQESDEDEALQERRFLLDAAPSIGRLLQCTATYNSRIESLNLSGNYLGGESCALLCTYLKEPTPLRRLNLNGNPLRVRGGHALAEVLASSECTLEELDIGNTELQVENLISIATALRSNRSLQSINLDNPVIKTKEEEAIQHIGKMLQVNPTLHSLSLCKHQLTDHGAQVLAERLLNNQTLQCLVLRANHIGASGAEALAALVLQHDSLSQLDLSANRIGDTGGAAFAKVLQRNTSPLAVLSLCSTYMTDEGLASIAKACLRPHRPERNYLQSLLLWGNDFGESSAAFFLELIDGGRFQEFGVETDFLPRKVDDTRVDVAHRDAIRAAQFASPKR